MFLINNNMFCVIKEEHEVNAIKISYTYML